MGWDGRMTAASLRVGSLVWAGPRRAPDKLPRPVRPDCGRTSMRWRRVQEAPCPVISPSPARRGSSPARRRFPLGLRSVLADLWRWRRRSDWRGRPSVLSHVRRVLAGTAGRQPSVARSRRPRATFHVKRPPPRKNIRNHLGLWMTIRRKCLITRGSIHSRLWMASLTRHRWTRPTSCSGRVPHRSEWVP